MSVELHDKATISSRVTDSRGFLHVKAKFSRVGIQRYTARELGLQGRPPGDILRVLRPEEEVFAQDSLDSFENGPITDEHPPENVTAQNSRKYTVGTAGKRYRDGDHTAGEVIITDAAAIAKIENGKAELSDGYACEIKLESGVWNGQAYDAIKQNIRGNHTAIVGAGRCGGSCRILDGAICEECGGQEEAPCNCHESETNMSTGGQASPQLVPRIVDGLTIETTTQGAQAIDKLTTQLADALRETETAKAALTAASADHTKVLETKDGEITGLKAKLSDEAIDALVTERAGLITDVARLMGADYDVKGKSSITLMTDVASKAYGAEAVKDRSEDYVKALYATVNKPSADRQDTVRTSLGDALNRQTQQTPQRRQASLRDDNGQDAPRGRDAYLSRLRGGRDHGQRQNGAS